MTLSLPGASRVLLPLLIAALTSSAVAIAADSTPKPGGTLRLASLQPDIDAFDPLTGYSTDSWEVLRAVTRQLVDLPGFGDQPEGRYQAGSDLAQSWT